MEVLKPGAILADVGTLRTNGQAGGNVGIFKLVDDDNEALRVNVKLGRSSVNTIEVA